jgi:hypothetical protein
MQGVANTGGARRLNRAPSTAVLGRFISRSGFEQRNHFTAELG